MYENIQKPNEHLQRDPCKVWHYYLIKQYNEKYK